jgi:lipoprotein-releasing system ATP-binding protein
MSEILVKINNLVKNYVSGAETLYILRGISFEVEQGTSIAITGQSGSGKSTLLNILGGLDKSDSGSIEVGGTEITRLSEKGLSAYRSSQVGFIFQFHYLLKDFTALENVMLPAYMFGMKKKDAMERARELLVDVKLDDRLKHFPSQLSGGERQRVAVARAMVNNPAIILADEPTGNLDPDNSSIVSELLYTTTVKWGKTLVVVTHDEKVAKKAQYQYVLEAGVLGEEEASEEVNREEEGDRKQIAGETPVSNFQFLVPEEKDERLDDERNKD